MLCYQIVVVVRALRVYRVKGLGRCTLLQCLVALLWHEAVELLDLTDTSGLALG